MQLPAPRSPILASFVLVLVPVLGFSLVTVCSGTDVGGHQTQSGSPVTLLGRSFDVPALFPDGSTRFHIIESPPGSEEEMVPVPAGGKPVAIALFEDRFDTGKNSRWQDDLGLSTSAAGRLTAGSDRNEVIVRDLALEDGRVAVDLKGDQQGGILIRYRDPDNFVLAFHQPAQKTLAFHEKVGGDWGAWIAPVPVGPTSAANLRMVVEVEGNLVRVTLSDAQTRLGATRCMLTRLKKPGAVGLYHDNSVGPGPQLFDNFQVSGLHRMVPKGAVQVVIPAPAMSADLVWTAGAKVKVTGREGQGLAIGGRLRAITIAAAADLGDGEGSPADRRLFSVLAPPRNWTRFRAEGFSEPVSGVVYRSADPVTNGMALGGIDTGCIDLETSGLLGYCTIFNTHVPRRGPLNLPILGLCTGGKTWVLCQKQPKRGEGGSQNPVEPVLSEVGLQGVETATGIHYWGHYPVADVEFETAAPVSVGLRAWTPFLPGDVVNSMVPGIIFEVHLRNPSDSKQEGTIAFSFPGPTPREAGCETFPRQERKGAFKGVSVEGKLASYVLGIIGEQKIRWGGELGADGAAWAKIAKALPEVNEASPGSSVAVDFSLAPGKEAAVLFVLAWHAPTWKGGGFNWAQGGNVFHHMYAKRYKSAESTGEFLAGHHKDLLARTLAWQQVVYTDTKLPIWLRDSLINILYCIAEDGFWAQREEPLLSWVTEEDGLFGLCECPRGCPQIECLPCSFYGSLPLVYFFPELQLSTMRGYKHYQKENGAPVWIFGSPVEMCAPNHTQYQASTNGISLAGVVDRFLLCRDTPDKKYLKEFYPMIKQTMSYNVNLGIAGNPAYSLGEQVMAMPNVEGNLEWFETQAPGWQGVAAHIGILRLAQLGITQRLAQQAGDAPYARQCAQWIKLAAEALEKRLWDPRGYYLNFFEPTSGKKSEFVFGYQLDGEWVLDHHGLPSPLAVERVSAVLETIKRTNIALTKYGAVNYANPDGTVANPGGYGSYSYFPPEALMLAMNYMYEGRVEFGAELARKVWYNLFCLQGYTWDVPNIMRGDVDTGERTFGNDYYQDMMLWSLPAALERKDVSAPCQSGGLVDRILKAAAR